MTKPALTLTGFAYDTLFHSKGLKQLDDAFLNRLNSDQPEWHTDLIAYRNTTREFSPTDLSELLIRVSVVLDAFLINLFDIEKEAALLQAQTLSHDPVMAFKKFFVLHRAKKKSAHPDLLQDFDHLHQWLMTQLASSPLKTEDTELAIGLFATPLIQNPEEQVEATEKLTQWCAHALITPEAKAFVKGWSSFHIPKRLDHQQLVSISTIQDDPLERIMAPSVDLRQRDGFVLTDTRMNARDVQNEVHYCIYCHDHEGDFCSKGFPLKKSDPALGFKKNPLDVTLTGCPLEEKISEMQYLKKEGFGLAALAMVMVDNPMCPATGHRICNDCMKACVYQKQEPVNIPEIETRVLTDVLHLPWGVEIYDLLTRWNPLRQTQWMMKPYNGLKVMVAGMGPAGFTLSHHLLLEGFAVVGFDGLKIEPLPRDLISKPIHRFDDLIESLDTRLMAGFGGVAEYGITVRWDKNFLKLIYLSLVRRPYFQVFGSTRFGGTITVDDAWKMGFDHFAIAVGAGLPKALSIPGSLAPGMRQANDFLMALQLGNAAKKDSLTNLQVRLPAVVVGGGLTGIDTATEVQAYYIAQVEKTLDRYEKLIEHYGEKHILSELDAASEIILQEHLAHGRLVREERERAATKKELPNFIQLIHQWGGVSIVYRRTLQESPAYISNHEEVHKALQEGIYYQERLEPARVMLDQWGHTEGLVCHRRIKNTEGLWESTAEAIHLPARAIFVATGTQPNVAYEFEHRGTFEKAQGQYHHYENAEEGLTIPPNASHCKEPNFGPFTSYKKDHYRVSLVGDTHPVFHGNVVKAIASGLRTYPKIVALFEDRLNAEAEDSKDAAAHINSSFCHSREGGNPSSPGTDHAKSRVGSRLRGNDKIFYSREQLRDNEYADFSKKMTHAFSSKVVDIQRRADNIIELSVHSPLAAEHYQPGHFFRLQRYEMHQPLCHPEQREGSDSNEEILRVAQDDRNAMTMEPLALLAIGGEKEILRFMVIEKGASSLLCQTLQIGDPVSIMGPTGVRAKIASTHETILIIGNQVSMAFALSYGHAARAVGNKVIYVGAFHDKEELAYQDQLEAATDVIIWSVTNGAPITTRRPQDYSHVGQAHEALFHYAKNAAKHNLLDQIDRIYIMGDASVMHYFQDHRLELYKKYFLKNPPMVGSVHSTMQCMLKGVCAQCLQWQIDPETGLRTKAVFACSWQDQPLERIDIDNIGERQIQNRLQETLTRLWVTPLLKNDEQK